MRTAEDDDDEDILAKVHDSLTEIEEKYADSKKTINVLDLSLMTEMGHGKSLETCLQIIKDAI